jgi:hypothetical protein
MGDPTPRFDKWIEEVCHRWNCVIGRETDSELLDTLTKSANDLADNYRALEEIKLHLITCTKAQSDQPETTVKKLNVGGKIYRFNRSSTEKLQGSLLGYMLSGDYDKLFARDKNGVIFLDLDPFWMDDILGDILGDILYPIDKANKQDECLYGYDYRSSYGYRNQIYGYLKVTDLITGGSSPKKTSHVTKQNQASIYTPPKIVDKTFAPLQNAMNKLAGLQAEFKRFHDKVVQAHAQYLRELCTYREELLCIATFVFAKRSDWSTMLSKGSEEELLEDIRALVSMLSSRVKGSNAVGMDNAIIPERTISLVVRREYFETTAQTLRLAPARTYIWNLASTEWGHTLDEEDGAIMINDFPAEGMWYILRHFRSKRICEAMGIAYDFRFGLGGKSVLQARKFCLLENEIKLIFDVF